MLQVFSTPDVAEAHLIRSALDQAGIRAVVQGELLAGALGVGAVGASALASVCVLDPADEAAAREIIRARNVPAWPSHCAQCGYDLTGLPEPRCPECGWQFRRPETWTCAKCGESIEGQFTACWKCGSPAPTAP